MREGAGDASCRKADVWRKQHRHADVVDRPRDTADAGDNMGAGFATSVEDERLGGSVIVRQIEVEINASEWAMAR